MPVDSHRKQSFVIEVRLAKIQTCLFTKSSAKISAQRDMGIHVSQAVVAASAITIAAGLGEVRALVGTSKMVQLTTQ